MPKPHPNLHPGLSAIAARAVALIFLLAGLSACSSMPTGQSAADAAYRAAIFDAAVVSPGKVLPLRPLPRTATVTMVSWVSAQRLPCANGATPCTMTIGNDPLWVTLAGEVQAKCRGWKLSGDALRQRLEQLLGLPLDPPPQFRKVKFALLEVPRARIERPCLGVNDGNAAAPVCTIDAQPGTPVELRNFVGQQMAGSYVIDNPRGPGYPYTRLGYTYDWGVAAGAPPYGASEFLVMPNSTATAREIIDTDAYCKGSAD